MDAFWFDMQHGRKCDFTVPSKPLAESKQPINFKNRKNKEETLTEKMNRSLDERHT